MSADLVEIRGKRFDRTRVRLDGHVFIGCTLVDCTLEFSGGECRIEETFFLRPSLEMTDAAANTVEVLHVLGALNEKMFTFPE